MTDSIKIIDLLEDIKKRIIRIEEKISNPSSKLITRQNSVTANSTNLSNKIDPTKLEYLTTLPSVLDQCLCLLNVLSKETSGKGGLTTVEMKDILAEKFGLTTITTNNISMSLKNVTGRYVTRIKISDKVDKYQYQILTKGKEYIENKIKNLQCNK